MELPPLPAFRYLSEVTDCTSIYFDEDMRAYATAAVAAAVAEERESREMFVARLDNIVKHGNQWVTVVAVLALLNDCDMLAKR